MRFTILAGLLLGIAQAVVVPSHSGPFSVTMQVKALTDQSRTDPFNKTVKRQVLLSVFSPISDGTKCSNEIIAYMPSVTAASYGTLAQSAGLPASIFSSFQLELCKLPNVHNRNCQEAGRTTRFPLVLFSPGMAESRLLYSVTAKSIAAQGYFVVTIDHPYEAEVVEFPDGSVVRRNGTMTDLEEQLAEIRALDMSFILSQLRQLSSSGDPLFRSLPTKINFDHVIAMGHSLGGAAAAQVLALDEHMLGGINLDGRLFNPVLESGTKQPFMLLGREKHADEDETWNSFWETLPGPKAMVGVAGTTHASFTDIPALIQSLGLPADVQSQVEQLLGTTGGRRMQEIMAGVCASFFTSVFTGNYRPLLDAVQEFSEVVVRKSRF